MSDFIQNGLLGALSAKSSISYGASENLKDSGDNAETAADASHLFADLFNVAKTPKSARLTSDLQTGILIKQQPAAALAAIEPTESDTAIVTALTSNDVTAEAPRITFDKPNMDRGIPSENYKELLISRRSTASGLSDLNPSFTKFETLPSSSPAETPERIAELLKKDAIVFTTVKLNEAQPRYDNSFFSKIKQAPPAGIATEFSAGATTILPPLADLTSAEFISVRPRAGVHAIGPLGAAFDVRQTVSEFTSAALLKASAVNAYARSFLEVSGQIAVQTPIDAEAAIDPALAPSSSLSSLQSAASATLAASSVTPVQVAQAGVLPQIEAAIVARNGRAVVEVRLDPPDLGRVRIEFNVENGETIKAVLGAERTETLDYLRRNIADLENHLRQAGFSSISFEFSDAGRQFGARNADKGAAEQSIFDSDDAVQIRPKIYLSARENARLDLLL